MLPIEQRLASFRPLTAAERQSVGALAEPQCTAERGDVLLAAGEPARRTIVIGEGWAILHRDLPDGRRQVIQFCLPGDLIDPFSLLASEYDFSVTALTRMRFSFATVDALTQLLGQHPDLALPLLWGEAGSHSLLRAHLLSIGRLCARERLAALLLELRERLAVVGLADTDGFRLCATQEILADSLGLSVVHLNRTLRRLELDGLLRRDGRSFLAIDQAGLRALVPEFQPIRPNRRLSSAG